MQDSLPHWDLSDIYPGSDSPELQRACREAQDETQRFAEQYRGKIAALYGQQLAEAIRRYEALEEQLGRIASYGDLLFSTHTTDEVIAGQHQNLQDIVKDCAGSLVFFTLEINKLEERDLQERLGASEALQHYQPWLRDIRAERNYMLDEAQEQLLIDKSTPANSAWIRLYEDVTNRLSVNTAEGAIGLTEALDKLSHPKEDVRREVARSLSEALSGRGETLALIFNTIIKDKAIDDKWRGFERPVSSRNLANLVEDEVVDTLADAVTERSGELSRRYYQFKAQRLGKDMLNYWDRNAPLHEEEEPSIPWDEAREIVLAAYDGFSPEMARIAKRFFDEGWIDAPVTPGKTSGAFSHPTTPSAHPYILLNYQGKVDDVMTLAHELGHGVHQVLAAEQGALMADTPLTLAETASVFGEQLTFQYLLSRTEDHTQRERLIASKVEDMLGTVVRQIAFYRFETRLHEARKEGELSLETIASHWMETQAESFGDAVRLEDSYRVYWMYVSHFIHAPFYVYAYAFGDCLVNALYATYEQERKAGRGSAFEANYLEMLRAGGRLRHKELLAPFGLDVSEPGFWQRGLDVIDRYIGMLETQ